MGRPTITALTFWDRVRKGKPNECWDWFGPVSRAPGNQEPYGRIDVFGFRGVYVHRVAYWLAHGGPLNLRKGEGLLVRHGCDNTLCCNPMHLELGTHADNMQDKVMRGRQHTFTSIGSPNAKLTADQVRDIRARYAAGGIIRRTLAVEYGVSLQTVKAVLSRRHYADVT